MLKLRLLSILLIVAVLLAGAPPALSQVTYAAYIWEKPLVAPNPAPGADEQDLRAELDAEVTAFLDWAYQTNPARPPGPFYTAPGYIAEDLYWLNPGESVLVLAETLDFLTPTTRDRLVTYLKYVMTTPAISPLTFLIQNNVANPLFNKANFRNAYPALPDELARSVMNSSRASEYGPPPENLYAVWAFAYYVTRYEGASAPKAWDIVNNNWSAVSALYAAAPTTTPKTYWEIMTQVGYARLAKRLGKAFATAESRANAGYAAGVNFVQFYKNMKTARWCEGNGDDQAWVGVWDYCLFASVEPYSLYQESQVFRHDAYAGQLLSNRQTMFASEVGRFLHDKAQTAVVNDTGYGLVRFTQPAGRFYNPFWWESRGEKVFGTRDAGTVVEGNGENAVMHPSFSWQLFLLKAYVEGAGLSAGRAETMRILLDTPWAIGDLFQLQKLVTVLRMYSTVQWTQADAGSTSLTASPAAARQGQTVTFLINVAGTGQAITVTDPLPSGLTYASNTNACPGTVGVASNTVTYSGTPSSGAFCTVTVRATVTTALTQPAVNTITVNDSVTQYTDSETVILNPINVHLPAIGR